MEDLLRQLVIRAESAGGEEWLRSCLTLPLPSVNTSASQLGVLEPEPEDPVINMGDVEQEALEGAEQDVLELSATVDPGLYAPEGEERPREMTSQKRQRKRTRAYTPPRRRSARRRAAQEGSQSRGGSLAGAVREQGAGEGTSNDAVLQGSVARSGYCRSLLSGLPLGSADDLVFSMLSRSVSPRTWHGYVAAWKDWVLFCGRRGFMDDTQEVQCFIDYVCEKFQSQLSYNSVVKLLAGISFFQKWKNLLPINAPFQIKQLLKGYKSVACSPDMRSAISFVLLGKLVRSLPSVCRSAYEVQLFKCAFLLAYFGALRMGEFLSLARTSLSPLLCSDVSDHGNFIKVLLRHTKTDRSGKGVWIRLFANECADLCPVKAYQTFSSMRPLIPGSLLMHADGQSVSRFQFNMVLKKCLSFVGCEDFKITAHSFRIGAATEAYRCGFNDNMIRQVGRWGSARFRIYVRPDSMAV
ncbi:uncharacterized protein [Eleutherodactylus coqui]|uniref:uncharacterized protein n=1 Tax=Eleutherodactylus coqui TaxID=57060 RepID=UPI003462566E